MVRRAVVALALGLAALALVPMTGTLAQSAGGVRADAEGWWNVGASTPATLPPSPIGALPSAPAPDVPDGSVPVATRLGQAARVGAIGFVVDAPKGSTVAKVVLHLKEAAAAGQEGTGAAVRACPISSFLVPESNGSPDNVPQENCDVAHADGVRAADGTWTFDLTAIAAAWLDPFGTIEPNGIRLDPVGDPPATFQVAFTGYEDATIDADITAGAATTDPFATGGSGGGFGGSTGGTDFAPPAVDVPTVDTPTTTAPAPAGGKTQTAAPAGASRAGDTLGNWPVAVVLLAVAALALALLMGWSLGPAGRHRPDLARRQGGVGRALASRLAPSKHAS
ncbi:MAG: hypothetical protein JWO68_3710 [Actinomycetia bacterium]|nr:hypothetical protein [Actinomycetes bacterium]